LEKYDIIYYRKNKEGFEGNKVMNKKKAIFLDRDGTINIDKGYLYKKEDFKFENDAIKALKRLSDLGYILIIVTNQSGIGRGYYTKKDLDILNKYMCEILLKEKIKIEKIYYCPHHPTKGLGEFKIECNCRKPNPGMIIEGIKEFDIDKKNSYMVGDKLSDVVAGISAGVNAVLLGKENEIRLEKEIKDKISIFENLNKFSIKLYNEEKK